MAHDDQSREQMKAGGAAIRRARMDRGLSQKQLAGAVGCGPASVARWEAGAFAPRAKHRPALARALGWLTFSSGYEVQQ